MSEVPPKNEPGAVTKEEAVVQKSEAPPTLNIEDLINFAFLEVSATQHRPINLRFRGSCS